MIGIFKNIRQIFMSNENVTGIAILASFIVSIIILLHNQPINLDGIIYLKSVKAFLEGGFNAAKGIYPWPLYPIIIAFISKLFHLSVLDSAYLLNAFLTAMITVCFVKLVKALNGSANIQKLAILIICIYPAFFHMHYYLVRGFGYLACSLAAIIMLIQFFKAFQWRYAILWGLFATVATLFRVEGSIFMLLVPFFIFFSKNKKLHQKLYAFFKLNIINILLVIALLLEIIIYKHSLSSMGRLQQIFQQVVDFLIIIKFHYIYYRTVLIQHVFNLNILQDNAGMFFIGGIITLFIVGFIKALNPIFAILAFHGVRYSMPKQANGVYLAIFAYAFINIAIVFLFVFERLFTTPRFFMLLSLLCLLFVPFSVASIYHYWRDKQPVFIGKVWVFPIVALAFTLMLVGQIFHIGPSKTYIKTAGSWVQHNTAKNAKVFVNDPTLVYYVNRPGTSYPQDFSLSLNQSTLQVLAKTNLSQFDYYAILITKAKKVKAEKEFNNLDMKILKTFTNNRGDTIFIMKPKPKAIAYVPSLN